MGKLTLNVEVDEATVRDLEARGIDPVRFAEVHFRDSYDRILQQNSEKAAMPNAHDPKGSMRRYREWAEASQGALDEQRRWIQENGVFGEQWRDW